MAQIHGDFFQLPSGLASQMSEVVTKIMKRYLRDTPSFFMVFLLFHLHPEMFNASLGEMIWPPLLA